MAKKKDSNPLMEEERRGPSWSKALAISLCVILGVVALGCGLIYYFGHNMISLSNYVADSDVQQVETLPPEVIEASTEDDGVEEGVVLNESELNAVHAKMQEVETVDTIMDENVYNILLVGVDRRDKSWNGNSDSMMLVSINNEKKRVSIISLMRDTYVDIPDHGYAKLNAAYAYGGGPLLTETIRNNFRIDVDRYAAVDFDDMINIIDAMGGVEITWTAKEVEVSNGYILDMCNMLNEAGEGNWLYEDHELPGPGTYNCDGIQAVAYARNRFVGNSDYQRTSRQRYVISQMMSKIQNMSVPQLTSFVVKCLPLVTHNINEKEIWDLVGDAPSILGYDFVTDRVPYDGEYEIIEVNGQGMLVPDWSSTIAQMQETIYGDGKASGNSDNAA